MTENKPIMIDELECNKCPDKKRCDEQRERKDNIINSMLDDIKDTAIAYHCDLKDKIKNLKQNLPIITRCDVVLEKQLARKTQECEELRTDIKDIANLLDLDIGEEYNFGDIEIAIKGLKQECEKIKNWVKGMMFYTDCSNWFERFVYAFDDWQTDLQKQLEQIKSAKEQAEQKLTQKVWQRDYITL